MLEEIKQLLGDQLAEGVAEKLVELVNTHVAASIATITEDHQEEIEQLKESAEEYGVYLQEAAEDFGVHLQESAEEYGSYVKTEVAGQMNEYLEYAVNDFISENKEKFVMLEDYARQSEALKMIQEAFEVNGFQVDPAKVAAVTRNQLAESETKIAQLSEELNRVKMEKIFDEATRSLADTQREKVKQLSEAVTFADLEDFTKTISLLVEQVVTPVAPAKGEDGALNEETKHRAVNDKMAAYLAKL